MLAHLSKHLVFLAYSSRNMEESEKHKSERTRCINLHRQSHFLRRYAQTERNVRLCARFRESFTTFLFHFIHTQTDEEVFVQILITKSEVLRWLSFW